jgi:hypothetical protein
MLLSEELGQRPRPTVVGMGVPQLLLLDDTHYLAGGAVADTSVRQVRALLTCVCGAERLAGGGRRAAGFQGDGREATSHSYARHRV